MKRGVVPETPLQRARNISVHIRSDNAVQIAMGEQRVDCGPHGLAILDTFYQPKTITEALAELQPRIAGKQDWMALAGTIVKLYEAGILQDIAGRQPVLGTNPHEFDAAPSHIVMLNDRSRTSKYLAAIAETVRPGDVVVDIGTGTGVFAVAAARAGAKRVYAIEASDIARTAQRVFETNNVADQITLIRGWSTQITLPARADVLISEIIGDDPLAEQVVTVTADAAERLLKPDARFVPRGIRLLCLPLAVPADHLARYSFTSEAAQRWQSWYGIDFAPLPEAAKASPQPFLVDPFQARSWQVLSEPILVADINLRSLSRRSIDSVATGRAVAPGRVTALLLCFELDLSPHEQLSTLPATVDRDNAWFVPLWILGEPVRVEEGTPLQATYKFDGHRSRVALVRTTA